MKADKAESIIQAYIAFLLDEGKKPASVYSFSKKLKIKESEFYKHYASFEAIEKQILLKQFRQLTEELSSDEVFESYSAREKYMAFLYAWIEKASDMRSLLLLLEDNQRSSSPISIVLKPIKEEFKLWAEQILREGIDKQEVKFRQFISDKYPEALFYQFAFVHRFWLKDDSQAFEKTDAAIEKSVHLAFDLMGQSSIDSAFDLGKFLFQNR